MRRKTRIIQTPLRRSPRKFPASTSRALPVLLTQDDEGNGKSNDPQKAVLETYSDSGENGGDGRIGVDVVEKEENLSTQVGNNDGDSTDSDSLGLGVCIRCDIRDDLVLVCGEIGCSIAVHERCMGCDPSFDGFGKFRCPVCERKRAVLRVEEARRKVLEMKRALSRFLESGGFLINKEGGSFKDYVCCDSEDRLKGMGNGQPVCGDKEKTAVELNGCVANGGGDDCCGGDYRVGALDEDWRKGMQNEQPGCWDKEKMVVQLNRCVANGGGANCCGAEDRVRGLGEDRWKGVGNGQPGSRDQEKMIDRPIRCVANNGRDNVSSSGAGINPVEEEGEEDLDLEPVDEETDKGREVSKGLDSNEGVDKRVSEKDEGKEGMHLEASDENNVSETENQNDKDDRNESIEEGEEESQPEASDELGNAKDTRETETVVGRWKRFKQTAGKVANARNRSSSSRSSPQVKEAMTRRKAIAKKNASTKDTTTNKSTQPANSYTIESFCSIKRKRLHWTTEEEQMLREGVEEFSREMNKNISWKSILEFGRQVFHQTRAPSDLKDKWKTMMAKEGSMLKKQ